MRDRWADFLFDEDIIDQVVDRGRSDAGSTAGPQNDTRGGEDFKCV